MTKTIWFLFIICAPLVVAAGSQSTSAADEQKNVLALYTDRSDVASSIVVDRTLRAVLSQRFNVQLNFQTEYMNVSDPARVFPLLRDSLRAKYSGQKFDVIIAVDDDAARFVRDFGRELFPGVPVVLWSGRNVLKEWGAGPPVTAVLGPDPVRQTKGTIEFIRTLQPDMRQLFIVAGASLSDRTRDRAAREAMSQYALPDFSVVYLSALPLDQVEQRLSNLPPKSAVLFLRMSEDGAGRQLITRTVLGAISSKVNAPLYALSAVNLDTGIVGGLLINQEGMARETGAMALRLLEGARIEDIPIRESFPEPIVDWRQLQRWNIDESRLPPGTAVLYREQSVWDRYKRAILAAVSIFVLQTLLLFVVLIHRSKLRRAEKAATYNLALVQATMDAMGAHVALLDDKANIIAVNRSWQQFATANRYMGGGCGVGQNYLKVCEASIECEDSRVVFEGIRSMIKGERENFVYVYDCSTSSSEAWFQLRAKRFISGGERRFVLTHENITEVKQAHDAQQQLAGLLFKAQDEERRRIARDLHDVTLQDLATIKAIASTLTGVSPKLEPVDRESITELDALCDQAIKELRSLSYVLHPPLLEELGLLVAIQGYARGLQKRCGIEIGIPVAHDLGRLPPDLELVLFRVTQECLTNVYRHSGSKRATIWITKEDGEVVLRIQDEGRGMFAKAGGKDKSPTVGVGIQGMRQRLGQLGGRLQIESDSNGTTVTARAPLSQPSAPVLQRSDAQIASPEVPSAL